LAKTAFDQSFALLRTRRYGTFVGATLLSNLGTWAQQVAEPWLLLTLGASSLVLGIDSFAQNAPVWVLTLLGGVLADSADRRRVIGICQSIQMLCPIVLFVLLLAGIVAPWIVILSSVVVGVTDALSMPSFQSIVPTIVEREQIPSALALNATQFNLSRILGPALAGALMASFGIAACFAANALSYLPFILVALWILPRGGTSRKQASGQASHLFVGLREITRTPYLSIGLVTVLATSLFCAPLIVFAPVLVRDALHGTAGDFSIAIAGFGLGGLIGAALLLGVPPQSDRRIVGSCFALACGFANILVALDRWASILPILLLLGGIAMSISNTSVNALLQTHSPEELRGRTVSLYMLAMRGGLSLGGLFTGMTVGALGVREALLLNGAIAIVTQLAIAWFWRRTGSPQRLAGKGLIEGS
jgi:MFS family permease